MLCRHIFSSGITIKVPRPHLIAFSFRQNKILQKIRDKLCNLLRGQKVCLKISDKFCDLPEPRL